MLITRQELTSKGKKEFESDIVFSSDTFKDNPLIISLDKVHVYVSSEYVSDLTLINIKIKADTVLHSTRSLKPVPYSLNIKDEFVIAYVKDETFDEDSMILLESDDLLVDELVYSLIVASLPLKVIAKDEEENIKGDNWEVISEDEYLRRQNSEENSPFASLKDLDL